MTVPHQTRTLNGRSSILLCEHNIRRSATDSDVEIDLVNGSSPGGLALLLPVGMQNRGCPGRHRIFLRKKGALLEGQIVCDSDAYNGYSKLASEDFINEVCARITLRSHGYKPTEHIRNVQCPVLIQICDHDSLAPVSVETEKELRKYAEVKHYPIGHFNIYLGDNFEKSVSDQLEFFKKNLL